MRGSPVGFLRSRDRVPIQGADAMRRVAFAFLTAGGLAALVGTVVPDPDTGDHPALLALGGVCLVLALVLAAWPGPPARLLACLPTLGLLLSAVAVAVARPLASTPSYYLLPILASAYFGSRRRLVADLAFCLGSLALVLALWVDPGARVAIFLGTAIPVLCVALVVAALRRRLDAQVDGLRCLADTDALTGALNHGAFGGALELAFAHSRASGTGATLLLIDIDHFKQVNDRFGHQEGDRMLRLVTDLLERHKRRDDVLGRIGGEEFTLLLPDADAAAARRVAERVRAALREATALTPARLTLSVGIAELSSAVGSSHALMHAADRALYAAKARGRDQAVDVADADGVDALIASPIA